MAQEAEGDDDDDDMGIWVPEGELDGEMSYFYATAFAKVGQTLTADQKERLASLRTSNPSDPKGPFMYSSPINMPEIENTDFLFGMR